MSLGDRRAELERLNEQHEKLGHESARKEKSIGECEDKVGQQAHELEALQNALHRQKEELAAQKQRQLSLEQEHAALRGVRSRDSEHKAAGLLKDVSGLKAMFKQQEVAARD